MEIQRELITPSAAKAYLEANIKNRRVKQPVVLRYAKEMQDGRWKGDTGELIKISESGVVLDGQHRLLAVVKSNVPTFFHVAKGVDDSVFDVLDSGSTRNSTDVFYITGVKYSNAIPAMIQNFELLKRGLQTSQQVNQKKTTSELLEIYNQKPEYWEGIACVAIRLYEEFSKITAPSILGGCYALFDSLNSEVSLEFMEQVCTGLNIKNDVITMLRKKLIEDKIAPRKMPPSMKFALFIKTWNYFLSGTCPRLLKFDTVNEAFPKANSR